MRSGDGSGRRHTSYVETPALVQLTWDATHEGSTGSLHVKSRRGRTFRAQSVRFRHLRGRQLAPRTPDTGNRPAFPDVMGGDRWRTRVRPTPRVDAPVRHECGREISA